MTWRAIYSDGTFYEGRYQDIDRSRLVAFEVGAYRVDVPAGARLIWRRRSSRGKHVWDIDIVAVEYRDGTGTVYLIGSDEGRQVVDTLPGWGTGVTDGPVVYEECEAWRT
jgi:hypothetical protein